MPSSSPPLLATDYTSAVLVIVGSLIGVIIAGGFNVVEGRRTREGARSAWIRQRRSEIYERYFTTAQALLAACQTAYKTAQSGEPGAALVHAKATVETAYTEFFGVYGVLQTVAEPEVVKAARIYAYRLEELYKGLMDERSVWGLQTFDLVGPLVRHSRHDMLEATRGEIEVDGSVRPPESVNAFAGTPLEEDYKAGRERVAQADAAPAAHTGGVA
jgi:hypothetical protein